jgi:hypothetical protein
MSSLIPVQNSSELSGIRDLVIILPITNLSY